MLIFMFMFFLVVSAQVDTFLREIFGSQANLEYAARSYFNTEDLRHSSAKMTLPKAPPPTLSELNLKLGDTPVLGPFLGDMQPSRPGSGSMPGLRHGVTPG